MGQKKKYSVGIDKVCEGTDTELHGDLKSFGTIQKVTKELGEWQEQNGAGRTVLGHHSARKYSRLLCRPWLPYS